MSEEIVNRDEFNIKVQNMFQSKNGPRTCWNKEHFEKVVKILIEFETVIKKSNDHYYYHKFYELVRVGNSHHICLKKDRSENSFVYVIPYEDFYDKLMEAHLATGHGARDRMHYYCKSKWKIPKDVCQLFSKMCTTCARKRSKPVKGVVVKPIVTEGFNMRGQVDLIDFQSCPDGNI